MSDDIDYKYPEPNGDLVEMRVHEVPKSSSHPEGLRYSLVCIRNGKRIIGYDDADRGTGISNNHRHIGKRITPYNFTDKWKLLEDFAEDLDKIKRGIIP